MVPPREREIISMHARWAAALRAGSIAVASLWLAACAPLHYKALGPQDRERVRQLEVQVVVPQETFVFSATAPGVSAALGGGLIPALIDGAVQKSRQEAMRGDISATIDRVIDLDYRAEAREAMVPALAGFPLNVTSHSVTPRIMSKADLDMRIAATKDGKAFLRLLTHYSLEPKSMTLTTRTHAMLWQDGNPAPSYLGSIISQGRALSAALDGPGALREQMRQATTDTIRLLALDLNSPQHAPGQKPKASVPILFNGTVIQWAAEQVSAEDGQTVVRDNGGALISVRTKVN